MNFANKGVAGAGLGLGIAGTALGLLNNGGGGILGNLFTGAGAGSSHEKAIDTAATATNAVVIHFISFIIPVICFSTNFAKRQIYGKTLKHPPVCIKNPAAASVCARRKVVFI